MNSYYFSVPVIGSQDQDEYVIFAKNEEQAQIMLTFFATEELEYLGWSGEDYEKYELSGSNGQLQKAINQNKAGLGIYNSGEGWKIVSLEEVRSSRYLE